ncbi:flagellar motor stator protein MotA [Iodidimonas muriae]|uniref:Flagellar motor stator protein MotA n=1 Tax=Iodidimonas muriae TaxID=261467 RepID=A0ABQ2LFJ3_9PROT|nr:flagellar motor stator protein MotA [Iodidimonas muriae]GER08586.1 flagellar motor stator protein MotA [Kordiimonadales bacterium JCM 17843]GGO15542.1 flagellar motor stator protein MotA [Iodidimonas muriae]
MNMIIGAVVVLASVLGGFAALGGHVELLWQPFEILIIAGSAFGAFIIGNPRRVVKDTGKALMGLAKNSKYSREDYVELLSLQFALFKQAKAKGMMSLERDIDDPFSSELFNNFPGVLRNERGVLFITDYLRLISLGSERAHELEALMNEEMETMQREQSQAPKAMHRVAESLPALGIVAAVLGVIKAMGAINQPPEILGGLIAGALVGTFMGVMLSYGFASPVAVVIKTQREEDLNYFTCIKAGLLAYLNGYAPQICVEYARKVLFTEIRPSFYEVEKATMLAVAVNKKADEQAAA